MKRLSHLFTCDKRNRGRIRLNFDEACLLYRACEESTGTVLEIGRKDGGSLELLVDAAGPERQVESIDLGPVVEPIGAVQYVGDSRQGPIGDYGFIFFDGDHTFEGLWADLELHWPQLTGDAVFHDAGGDEYWTGVSHVVHSLLGGAAILIERAGSCVWLHKTGPLGQKPLPVPDLLVKT